MLNTKELIDKPLMVYMTAIETSRTTLGDAWAVLNAKPGVDVIASSDFETFGWSKMQLAKYIHDNTRIIACSHVLMEPMQRTRSQPRALRELPFLDRLAVAMDVLNNNYIPFTWEY